MKLNVLIWMKAPFSLLLVFSLLQVVHAAGPRAVITHAGLSERIGVLFVARDYGIFQKHGLDAQVVQVRSAQVGMSAIFAGESQFHVASATGAAIGAMARGLGLVFIAGLINKLDGYIVVAPHIKNPTDLKGKNMGVQSIGGGGWIFTLLALEHWGLNVERDNIKFRPLGDQSVIVQALATGTIDGAYLGYTFAARLKQQGFRILADLSKLGIPFQGVGIMSLRSLIDRSPEIPEKVLRAVVDTIGFISNPANKGAVVRSLAKGLRLQRVEDAEEAYGIMREIYDRRIYPNVDGLRNVIQLLGKTNENIRQLKAEDLVDDRVLRKLEKEGLF